MPKTDAVFPEWTTSWFASDVVQLNKLEPLCCKTNFIILTSTSSVSNYEFCFHIIIVHLPNSLSVGFPKSHLVQRMQILCASIHVIAQNCFRRCKLRNLVGTVLSREVHVRGGKSAWFFVWFLLFVLGQSTINYKLSMAVCMWFSVDICYRNIKQNIVTWIWMPYTCGCSEVEFQHDVWRLLLDREYETHFDRQRHRLSYFPSCERCVFGHTHTHPQIHNNVPPTWPPTTSAIVGIVAIRERRSAHDRRYGCQ